MPPEGKKLQLLTLALVILLVAQVLGWLESVNAYIYARTPSVNPTLIGLITNSAGFWASVIYVLLFLLWDLKGGKLRPSTLSFVLSIPIGMVMVGLLKVLTGVPRPGGTGVHWSLLGSLRNADYFAFPSGHTTRASILASFLSERFPGYKALWWGYAILIALSRLFLHVHWLSDVLFGLLLGPWVFMLVECTQKSWLPLYRAIIKKLGLGVLDVE
ncbi:phosphatidic acid phosphatase [Thermococcus sp. P6]|uniref:phosphatase PAP2 family protein n=1 Tax=Thermococcus sp. P6 TaxID=122420 RepID=UPI000B5988CE|nr:phosphatase PAP2 family protein [Thermococcus sp. P6]ASJ11181.1 phosphatidic acid phosphatase [Thermococcus sp. P6]